MNADTSPGVSFDGDLGAEAPALQIISIILLSTGAVFLVVSIALIVGGVVRAGRVVDGGSTG